MLPNVVELLFVNASTSSPATKFVTVTVAEASVVLSRSLTVRPLSITTGGLGPVPAASDQAVLPAVSTTTGSVSVGVMLTVLVLATLGRGPSLATTLMVRVVEAGSGGVLRG